MLGREAEWCHEVTPFGDWEDRTRQAFSDSYHTLCCFLARETDSVLLAVGYRKLPEHPHPVGLQDCLCASIHFLKSLKTYGVDPSRVVICGESIGGSAAASILQILLGRLDLPKIRAQVLIYPILQAINFQLPSHLQNQNVPFLTRDLMITCILNYFSIDPSWKDVILTGSYIPQDTWMKYRKWLGSDNIPQRFGNKIQQPEFPGPFNKSAYPELKDFLDIKISPLVADNEVIAQLPEALLVSIHWDVLRDDILLYKKRLEDQGVPVTWYHVEDGFHGCLLLFDKKIFSFPCCWNIINAVGNILEKMNICSMPRFVCLVQDCIVSKESHGVFVKDLHFGTIPVRLFQPKAASSKPRRGIIFLHGGGAVLGSLDSYHNLCTFLARETDSVLLSVGYRKLPYYHHPYILYDCLNASIHFLKSLNAYGVDPSRVVLCGDSIGAAAVAIVTQNLVGRADLPKIRAQVLLYPVLQALYFQFPSNLQNANVPFLTKDFMMTCVCKYMSIDPSWKDAMLTGACMPPSTWKKYEKWLSPDNIPKMFRSEYQQPQSPAPFNEAAYLETKHTMSVDASPLLAEDKVIAQVPEAFLVTLQWDILRDDALLYKKRLEDQGVPVTWYHVADGFHGCIILFDKKFFSFPCALNIVNAVVSYIKGL
ncbi:arylacetamide deacetylase-like 4-like protein [Cricetulus griseus]|uniref:Arylacetamide deacetylase-like 4-like protein n=1 Tax=Cricetulus griseus TaxID=10029 RepID=A0A061ICT6_CRIGR|nr:arylacetamide deacetylase-like 4-like protein [Cricetulus griseus]